MVQSFTILATLVVAASSMTLALSAGQVEIEARTGSGSGLKPSRKFPTPKDLLRRGGSLPPASGLKSSRKFPTPKDLLRRDKELTARDDEDLFSRDLELEVDELLARAFGEADELE